MVFDTGARPMDDPEWIVEMEKASAFPQACPPREMLLPWVLLQMLVTPSLPFKDTRARASRQGAAYTQATASGGRVL